MIIREYYIKLTLLRAYATLEFVATDMVDEWLRTPRENHYFIVGMKRFSVFPQIFPPKRITSVTVAQDFVTHRVFNYVPPVNLLSCYGPQCTSNFFEDVSRNIDGKHMFFSTYQPQSNGKLERFIRTMLNALGSYAADNPKD